MKKALSFIFTLGILFSAISCQQDEFSNFGKDFKIKATIAPIGTKVNFESNDNALTPTWAVGDQIIGCDDLGNKFTFTVTSLKGSYAEFDANGYNSGNAKKVYAVYYPGKTVDDIDVVINDTTFKVSIPVDLSTQDGKLGGTTPSIMTATAEINGRGIALEFAHQTAVIGITKLKVKPGENIKSIAVTGAKTTATLSASSQDWAMSYNTFRKPVTVATDLTADSEGIISTPIYVAVCATSMVNLAISATNDKGEKCATVNPSVKSDLEKGMYYYTSRILGSVATIVETGKVYGCIEDAFKDAEAATQSSTIKLLANCTITEDMPILNNTYGITIDLNGKILTNTASTLNSDEATMYKRITVGAGYLTIKDDTGEGKIVHSAGNTYTVVMNGPGQITMESGAIESLYPDGSAGSVAILLTDGKLILNGGTFNGNSSTYGTVTLRGTSTTIPELTIPADSKVKVNAINKNAIYLELADAHFHGGEITTGADYAVNAVTNCYVDIDGGKFTSIDPDKGTMDAVAIRFYDGPNVEITGGEFFGTGRAFSCNGSSTYTGEQGVISIKGGKFSCETGYTVYNGRKADLTIEGGSFYSEKNANVFQGYSSGSLTIADGYFYTASDTLTCIAGGYSRAYGGYYNTVVNDANLTNGKVLKQLATPVEYEGRSYGYTLGENDTYVAEVNGTKYKDMISAATAATEYVASGDPVLKLLDDCKLDATVDLTNIVFKEVTLDLNGHTLTTTAKDSCITTKGVLTITDNSAGAAGKIDAQKRKVLFLEQTGTINIKKVTIECSATGAYTDHCRAIISIRGKLGSGTQDGTVNISDGAKIIADNWFKCIYVGYGKLNTENCEITSGYKSEKAYYGIYTYTGSVVTVNEGTSIKCTGSAGTNGTTFYVGSGNTANGSLYTINGGYFYGAVGSIASGSSSGVTYASKTLKVNGGYFSHDISATNCHYGDGKSLQAETNKHSHMGEELTYNYVVK